MALFSSNDEKAIQTLKKTTRLSVACPICKQKIRIGVELGNLQSVDHYPISHINLHGDPIHAMIVYLDYHFAIRGIEGCGSIEVLKDGKTFQQILAKWSNPY